MRNVLIITLAFLLLTVNILTVFAEDVALGDVFTDEAFLGAICEKLDIKDPSDAFSEWEKEISEITELSLSGEGISTLDGIEHFTSLKHLDISENELSEVDLSSNVALIRLIANGNPINALDLSANTALKYAYLQDCHIESIILPKSITKLFLQGNRLESLDLDSLTALTELNLKDNLLKEISISKCTKLKYLWLGGNKLESADLPDAEFETVILGTQEYIVGVKSERTYSPTWNILSSSVTSADGTFKFTAEKLPASVECVVNIGGYPMSVEFTALDMRGDVISDNMTNSDDLSYVLYHYGTDDETCDIDQSGNVSAEDISVILSTYANYADR